MNDSGGYEEIIEEVSDYEGGEKIYIFNKDGKLLSIECKLDQNSILIK